jgi:hypothetical protein
MPSAPGAIRGPCRRFRSATGGILTEPTSEEKEQSSACKRPVDTRRLHADNGRRTVAEFFGIQQRTRPGAQAATPDGPGVARSAGSGLQSRAEENGRWSPVHAKPGSQTPATVRLDGTPEDSYSLLSSPEIRASLLTEHANSPAPDAEFWLVLSRFSPPLRHIRRLASRVPRGTTGGITRVNPAK